MQIKKPIFFYKISAISPIVLLKIQRLGTFKFSYLFGAVFLLFSTSAVAINENDIDYSISPKNNFFQHANGLWLKSAASSPQTCNMDAAEQELIKRRRVCINDFIKSPNPNKILTYYQSLMTHEARVSNTILTIRAQLDKMNVTSSTNNNDSDSDSNDEETNWSNDRSNNNIIDTIVKLNQLGISGTPTKITTTSIKREKSLVIDLDYENILNLNKKEVEDLFSMASYPLKPADTIKIISVNNYLASLQKKSTQSTSRRTTEIKMSDLAKNKSYNWLQYLKAHGIYGNGSELIYVVDAALDETKPLLGNIPLDDWRVYLKFRYLYEFKNILTLLDDEEDSMTDAQKKELAIKQIENIFRADLGRLCFDKYLFSTSSEYPNSIDKEIRDTIMPSVVKAYTDSINARAWKDPATKYAILNKLTQLRIDIGYEYKTERKGYSTIPIIPENPIVNTEELKLFDYQYNIAQRGLKSPNFDWRDEKYDSLNASYSRQRNEIIITLATVMQPHFIRGDYASNYGSVGTTIGHEIGHMFDKDMPSNSYKWLTNEEDRKEFMTLAQRFEQQYRGQYSEITLNEDMADKLGLDAAYKAFRVYKTSLKGQSTSETKEAIPDDKRFFYSYAQSYQKDGLCPDLYKGYSSNELSANITLKNLDDFHTIFGIEKGDGMFLDEKDRVKFW